MTPELRESRAAVSKAGRATSIFLAISVALMVALGGVFSYLAIRQDTLQDSIREDALWAVYQLDREARSLAQATDHLRAALGDGNLEQFLLRYDILYSRLSILDNAKYQAFFLESPNFVESRAGIRAIVTGMEGEFDAFAATGVTPPGKLVQVASGLKTLQRITEDLLSYTNSSVSAARADAREEIMQLQKLAAGVVLALGLSICLLIFNLMRQLTMMRRASDRLQSLAGELSAAYKAAEAGNRAKSEFMATMSHEIRTPLNAILGIAELMAEERQAPQCRENLGIIIGSGQALLEIINEILDFAKIEHGDFAPEQVPFDAADLVRETARLIEGRARQQQNTVEIGIDGQVDGAFFIGDPTRLRRVLLNLLSNAVKFTKGGTVGIAVRPVPQGLRFEIRDTGIGIAEDALPRLFNAFSQVDGTISRRFGGTGLGLAICKRIVEGLGGKIGVESTLGSGSLFWFEVPADRTEPPADTAAIDLADRTVLPLDILVVEDNAVNRQVAQRFLEKLGQRVTLAVDGEDGVAMAAAHRFDLILMDMQMPGLDGIAATRAIRTAEDPARRVPIVAMTANASEADRRRCAEAGMDGFEAKPVSLAALSALIARQGGSAAPADAAPMSLRPQPELAPASAPRRDPQRVRELQDAIGDEGLGALVAAFIADSHLILRDLAEAAGSSDAALYDRSLHSLKGAASNLGFASLAAAAEVARARPLDPATLAVIGAELEDATRMELPEAA